MNQTNTSTRRQIKNVAEDDEQHNVTLRRRNHKTKQKNIEKT